MWALCWVVYGVTRGGLCQSIASLGKKRVVVSPVNMDSLDFSTAMASKITLRFTVWSKKGLSTRCNVVLEKDRGLGTYLVYQANNKTRHIGFRRKSTVNDSLLHEFLSLGAFSIIAALLGISQQARPPMGKCVVSVKNNWRF